MTHDTINDTDRIFSALADPTRRDMVARLAIADATVSELARPLWLHQVLVGRRAVAEVVAELDARRHRRNARQLSRGRTE